MSEINNTNDAELKRIMNKIPNDDFIINMAELFKVFGDSTRVKIIAALMEKELCVCDLAYIIHASQSAVSHQLRILKQSKLVKYRKEGQCIFYSLDDTHVEEIYRKGYDHVEEI